MRNRAQRRPQKNRIGINPVLGGGVQAFSPADIANLLLWERPDAGCYQEAALSTPATANNDRVGGQQNQSGATNNATQATAGKRLTLKTAQINGLPVLDAVGASMQFLTLDSALTLTGAFTVYFVASRASLGICVPFGSLASPVTPTLEFFSDGQFYAVNDAGDFVSVAADPSGNFLARFRRTATDACKITYTGQAEQSISGTLTGAITFDVIYARDGAGHYSTAKFGDLLVYGADLVADGSDPALVSYLTNRWGLALP